MEEIFIRELYAAALINCVEWLQNFRMRVSLDKLSLGSILWLQNFIDHKNEN